MFLVLWNFIMVCLELGLVLFVGLGILWALSIWRLMHFSLGDICMNYFINDFSPLHFSILYFCNSHHLLLKLYTAPLLLLSFISCFLFAVLLKFLQIYFQPIHWVFHFWFHSFKSKSSLWDAILLYVFFLFNLIFFRLWFLCFCGYCCFGLWFSY